MKRRLQQRRLCREHWLLLVACVLGAPPLARADAPPNWYTTPFNVVVHDTKTGLYWQRAAGDPGTFDRVATQCDELVLAEYTDWRVPSMKELQTLVDEAWSSLPPIDHLAFPDQLAERLWTSSTSVQDTSNGWTIDFSAHGDAGWERKSFELRTLCVRD